MAGLSDVSASEGAVPPETLKKLLAAYQANPSLRVVNSEGESGPTYAADQGVSADGYTISLDPNTGKPVISKSVSRKTWGQDKAAVFNLDGTFNGYSSGDSEALSAAKFVAGSVGGYYGAGALNSATGAAATGATAAGGASGVTTGGLSAVDSLLAGGGLGAETGTLVGGSALTSGGTATLGTTLADAGIMSAAGGGGLGIIDAGVGAATGGLGTAKDVVDAAKTTNDVKKAADTTKNTKTAVDGWDALTKVGTGLVTSAVVGDALSDPVDTSRYDKLFDNLLNEQALASQRGKDLWADYTNIWKPAQQKFAETAMNYDTAGRREQAAQEASGLVATEYDQKRSAATRDMQMAGVDPSTISALGAASQAWEAKDRAGAQNAARDNVEKTGLNLLKGVVDQGNTVLNQSTDQSRVATGNAGTATNVLNSQGNVQNTNTANRNAMIGDLFGAGLQAYGMYTSSKKTKHVGGKVDGLAAAKAIEKSPAKRWAYKKGEGDGNTKQRMGPMAEDLKREAPQVSNGKQVDGIAQLGLHHAAIGGLSKRLERIEKKLGGLADARRA